MLRSFTHSTFLIFPRFRNMAAIKKMNIFAMLCRILLILGLVLCLSMAYLSDKYQNCQISNPFIPLMKNSVTSIAPSASPSSPTPTNLSHLVIGLVGSEKAWHWRKSYIESWWRPNVTRGFLFLDRAPSAKLLPWSPNSPPYRVSEDLRKFLNKKVVTPQRILNGIMETYKADHENMRWLVMGDDDSIFFLDNMVDVLAQYDHMKYYYFGCHSEFIYQNYRHSFIQGFGGGGFILSYGLAKALAEDMENCLLRYRHLNAADQTTMSCIADFGVSLTSLKGLHQIDLRGNLWGYLSAHPNFPLMSLHHFDMVDPIFPAKDRIKSTRHLMEAAAVDQSRMLQQTVCHHHPSNWSFSISWGYSAQIYQNIMPRSQLQMPLQTFSPWLKNARTPPLYMFNTRLPSADPCRNPHVFFYETIEMTKDNEILTNFTRAWPKEMAACSASGNHSASFVSTIQVYSPATRRPYGMDRSECCDVVQVEGDTAEVRFRDCAMAELIA